MTELEVTINGVRYELATDSRGDEGSESSARDVVRRLKQECETLRRGLEREEREHASIIDGRDTAEGMLDELAALILGEPIDWPDHYAKWIEAQHAVMELKAASRVPEPKAPRVFRALVGPRKLPPGVWRVKYANGHIETYEFRAVQYLEIGCFAIRLECPEFPDTPAPPVPKLPRVFRAKSFSSVEYDAVEWTSGRITVSNGWGCDGMMAFTAAGWSEVEREEPPRGT